MNQIESFFVWLMPQWITPNLLSWSRVWAVPMIGVLFMEHRRTALLVYVLACLTDWLDGVLARGRNEVTPEGKRLDELTDKALVLGVVILFWWHGVIHVFPRAYPEGVLSIAVWAMIVREITVTIMRGAWSGRARQIPVLPAARAKTMLVMAGLGLLMFESIEHVVSRHAVGLGIALVLTATLLALVSWVQYTWYFLAPKRV